MPSLDLFLISLGVVLLLGLLTATISARTFLPRVTTLILLGILLGEDGFNLLPTFFKEHFDVIGDLTLMMVGFLLGGKLSKKTFANSAKAIMVISIAASVGTALIVALGLILIGIDAAIAILLGTIASATEPAAIVDVIKESGRDNLFTKALLSIVALDDVWALLLFALSMAFVMNVDTSSSDLSFIYQAFREIVGAITLGLLLGIPSAFLTGRIRKGQPMMLEALGIVSVCGGLAIWLDLSYLIACMVLGAVVVNFAKHHHSPFHAIKDIESLFLVVFFVVAGASLDIAALQKLGYLGVAYIVLRCSGKYFSAWASAVTSSPAANNMAWMRYALFPQGGVSIGMALVASAQFPEYQQTLLTLVVGSTVFFELLGPIFTRIAITKATSIKGQQK